MIVRIDTSLDTTNKINDDTYVRVPTMQVRIDPWYWDRRFEIDSMMTAVLCGSLVPVHRRPLREAVLQLEGGKKRKNPVDSFEGSIKPRW
jgi:hypothetical protein